MRSKLVVRWKCLPRRRQHRRAGEHAGPRHGAHDAGRGSARPPRTPRPSSSRHSLSCLRVQVNEYLRLHNLEAILADAVNDAVTARAADPVSFIADALSKLKAVAAGEGEGEVEGEGEGEGEGER